jgi:3-hydroxyisobutyrate dehydrogenase-like beta-hydroxyacid dehydrogenase
MTHTIGLLHPGDMGATVGAAARLNEVQVVWASDGRGPRTRSRAEEARLTDVGSLPALVEHSRVILSVCPPHAATELARAVAEQHFSGVYVDANAVSPATSRDVRQIVEAAGASFVDGGIIGPPALKPGTTRLYLSGAESAQVVACFRRGPLEACVLDGPPGAASALKVTYAAYTKGTAALLIAIRTLAMHEGVDAALIREWEQSQAELPGHSAGAVRANARKAWRFSGEMEEIADTFAAAGLPDGFHRAAAEVYRRMTGYRDAANPPSVEEAATQVLAGTASGNNPATS